MAKSSVGHKRTKHIDIKHNFIRETVQTVKITLSYCPTADMLADIFTKRLPRTQFEKLKRWTGTRLKQLLIEEEYSTSVVHIVQFVIVYCNRT